MLWAGTDAGLFTVDSGTAERVLDGAVRHVAADGDLTVVAGGRVMRGLPGTGFEVAAPAGDLTVHCTLPLGGRLLAGTSGAHLADVAGGRVEPLESFDAVAGRSEWYTPWGDPPDVRSLSPAPDGGVLVNVHVGGIWWSPDLDVWQQVVETDADVHQVHAATGGRAVVAAAAVGFGESRDAGMSWTWTADGLHAPYCRAVAVAGDGGDVVLVSASTGPFTDHAALYRREAGEPTFRRCDEGLPAAFPDNIDTHCLVASGSEAAFGTPGGDVFTSPDAGATWGLAASGLPPIRCMAI